MAKRGQTKRKDKDRIVLRKGETQRSNGTYDYRWMGTDGRRHSVYASTLDELREKEAQIAKDENDGIKSDKVNLTINELFDLWKQIKRGLKDNTFQNYKYMYNKFVRGNFGRLKISSVKKSDVKRFYNYLADECGLQASTIDSVHTILHQVFDMAVDDCYIRTNPSDNVLRELKQSHAFSTGVKHALTKPEQELFMNFLRNSREYGHWYTIFAVMLGTGLRVGEATGLRWCDVDFEQGIIDVNHTLVYYCHRDEEESRGCSFNVNTPKTKAGIRQVPMLDFVREALIRERNYQKENDIHCRAEIDGYSDFIFVNRFGDTQHLGTLNKAINRIIKECNKEVKSRGENNQLILPHFSCHTLRHTFTTRMCEAGVNIKVIQNTLGHADISTTLNIYADVTKELKRNEFIGLDKYFKSEVQNAV